MVGNVRFAARDRTGAVAAYEDSPEHAQTRRRRSGQCRIATRHQSLQCEHGRRPPRAQVALREALAIAEALAREGKRGPRKALAKLPPEDARGR
jgi:hypothetical protein